jgi:hypothetical protein
MSEPVYALHFTAHRETPAVLPDTPVMAGYTGDHGAARLTFEVSRTDCRYRIEITDGSGAYDITQLLTAQNGAVTWDVPASWTAPGTAAVRLVEVDVGEDGTEQAVFHYPSVSLFFADRENGNGMGEVLPCWQQVMTEAETATQQARTAASQADAAAQRVEEVSHLLDTAETTAQAAETTAAGAMATAKEAVTAAEEAQTRADTVKGVYVGSGDMPEGYHVQIDPDGEVITPEEIRGTPCLITHNLTVDNWTDCVSRYSQYPVLAVSFVGYNEGGDTQFTGSILLAKDPVSGYYRGQTTINLSADILEAVFLQLPSTENGEFLLSSDTIKYWETMAVYGL